jgi:Ca2+:H+ antiporter
MRNVFPPVCAVFFLLSSTGSNVPPLRSGGTRYAEQAFMATASQLNSSLLLFSVIAVLIPSAFHFSITTTTDGAGTSITTDEEKADILALSHGVAIILLLIYMGYLLFQFFTHADLFADRKGPTGSTRYPDEVTRRPGQLARKIRRKAPGHKRAAGENDLESEDSTSANSGYLPETEQPQVVEGGIGHAIAHVHGTSSAFQRNGEGMMVNRKGQVVRTSATRAEGEEPEEDDEEEEPELNWQSAIICMILISAVVGVTAEFLVGSINGLVETHPALSQEWVGLILLPIIGNAAEHLTALITAYKDKVDLALAVAVGSSIQIALFVIPIIVLIGWIIGKPLL